ncbi:hypothetical protein AB0E66_17770 [Streptomyces sp. NPDC033753]
MDLATGTGAFREAYALRARQFVRPSDPCRTGPSCTGRTGR